MLRDLNMKNFTGAWLDVSIHTNRLQGAVTPTGMIVNAIFCLITFSFLSESVNASLVSKCLNKCLNDFRH